MKRLNHRNVLTYCIQFKMVYMAVEAVTETHSKGYVVENLLVISVFESDVIKTNATRSDLRYCC